MEYASLSGSTVECVWVKNHSCPGYFSDVFDVPGNVHFVDDLREDGHHLVPSWNPAKFWNQYQAELSMPLLDFLRRVRARIRQLEFVSQVAARGAELLHKHGTSPGSYVAVHWRGTGRFRHNKRMVRQFHGGLALSLRRWPIAERLETAILPEWLLERRQLGRTKRAIARAVRQYRDVLIASDDGSIAASLSAHVRRLGGRPIVFEHERNLDRRRQTSLTGAGIDLWLLSNAGGIIGTDFNSSYLAVACIRARQQPLNGPVRFSSEIHGEALA